MKPEIRPDVVAMERSGIRQVMDIAWATPNVIHLEVGEPNFSTPEHICEAAAKAIRAGETRYTPNAGVAPLREALADKVHRINGINAHPDQVTVSAGAVQAIYAAMISFMAPGDEILLPDPGWPNFRMMATLLSATPIYYPLRAENGFLPDAKEIASLVTPRTKAILINTPSNPLGTVIPAKVLQEIYEMASKHNLWIVSDECYDQITFEQPMASIGANDPEERVISTYSFSKSYAMTGWRVGYAITPKRISGDIAKLQEPLISCVSSPAQFAALAALQGPQECIQEMRDAYRERRDAAAEVAKAANLDFIMPAGAFYFWLGIKETKMPSLDFVLKLVREHAIATAHGSAFGNFGEGYVRVSLANTKESILKGVTAIANQHAQLIQHN
ncbi:MAG: aminotransferase class I/II-fold pyridoxal phosphate-dependent enzyme [Actinobacteria bacterium]|uniref:Unannotated protein n=2 Tax=freshwater metagenome TaxID=449393 RepID=A0A6J6N9V8_9ZZZZ|nr:aminotransferase class I/II-fold pyridoxal phosphate-dependent enzyme [Actinomycetota bacterium]MTA50951.1 aminotransferase class I/II-fold pyridoxal phosphate-dependent enzyme [Actinomycetota bacterium]